MTTSPTQIEVLSGRLGFVAFGMGAFVLTSYALGIDPLRVSTREFWASVRLSDFLLLLAASVLFGFLGARLGARLALEIVFRLPSVDRGWSNLERSKRLWQSIPDLASGEWYGRINPAAVQYSGLSQIASAKALLRSAMDHAPTSHYDATQAKVNAAIAVRELGFLHRAINEFDESRNAYEKSRAILLALGGIRTRSRDVLSAYRETVFRLAELDHALGNVVAAKNGYRESLQVDALLGHDDPSGEAWTRRLLQRLEE